jgi:hypothetical protein
MTMVTGNTERNREVILAFEFDNDYSPEQIRKGKAHSKYTGV